MKDKPIKEQYQDKAQEVLERPSKMKDKTLSDKIEHLDKEDAIILMYGDCLSTRHVKDFISKLKEESDETHACEVEGYPCKCEDKTIEDNNCWLVPKKLLDKIAGGDLI